MIEHTFSETIAHPKQNLQNNINNE